MLQHLAPPDLCRKLERIGCSSVRYDVTNNAVSDVTSMKYACAKDEALSEIKYLRSSRTRTMYRVRN